VSFVSGTLGAGGRGAGRGSVVGGSLGTEAGGRGAAFIPPELLAPPPGTPGGGRIAGDAGKRPADGAGPGPGGGGAGTGRRPADGAPAGGGTGMRPAEAAPADGLGAGAAARMGPAPGAPALGMPTGKRAELSGGGAARWMRGPAGRPPGMSRSGRDAARRGFEAGGKSNPGFDGAGIRGLDAAGISRAEGGGSVSSRFRRMRGFDPCGRAAPRAVRSPRPRTEAGA
jgi:hypothetical protein